MACYSQCPYERYGGDNWGDCAKPSMQNTPGAHCYEPKYKGCDSDDVAEGEDYCERCKEEVDAIPAN